MSYTYDATALGQFGNAVLAAGQQASGSFAAIQVISNTVFTSITDSSGSMGLLISPVSIPAGTILYGRFTSVSVTTGLVVVYKNGIK